MIKRKKSGLGEQMACVGRGEVHKRFWCTKLREGEQLDDLGLHEKILLKRILNKWV
jgi:hypothetical protein